MSTNLNILDATERRSVYIALTLLAQSMESDPSLEQVYADRIGSLTPLTSDELISLADTFNTHPYVQED